MTDITGLLRAEEEEVSTVLGRLMTTGATRERALSSVRAGIDSGTIELTPSLRLRRT